MIEPDKTEQELIEKAKTGDSAAFGRLYDQYITQIFRFIVLKVDSRHIAEDITHEVFMSAWQKLPNFKEQGYPFGSWLYTIARHKVIDHYRTKKGHLSIDDEAISESSLLQSDDQSDQLFDVSLKLTKIKQALSQLTDEQQEVITLRFVNDLQPSEIAHILNKREGTVRIIQHRAIQKLKKILGEHPYE